MLIYCLWNAYILSLECLYTVFGTAEQDQFVMINVGHSLGRIRSTLLKIFKNITMLIIFGARSWRCSSYSDQNNKNVDHIQPKCWLCNYPSHALHITVQEHKIQFKWYKMLIVFNPYIVHTLILFQPNTHLAVKFENILITWVLDQILHKINVDHNQLIIFMCPLSLLYIIICVTLSCNPTSPQLAYWNKSVFIEGILNILNFKLTDM